MKNRGMLNYECRLGEQDILALQDKFLTNGFHHITTHDVYTGRMLVDTFLAALNYYNAIACLSTQSDFVNNGEVINVYQELKNGGYIEASQLAHIEEYVLEEFEGDFLWIEATPALEQSGWLDHFKCSLIDMHVARQMPIIIVSYDS